MHFIAIHFEATGFIMEEGMEDVAKLLEGVMLIYNQSVQQSKGEQPQNKSVKMKNPLDANGSVTKRMVCRSIYHWAKDCPDRNSMYTACQEEEVHITLFSKNVM